MWIICFVLSVFALKVGIIGVFALKVGKLSTNQEKEEEGQNCHTEINSVFRCVIFK